MSDPDAVLLLQLGTPDSPEVPAVRRYLREFLSDPYVIDIPAPLRYLLVYGIILPTRPKRSAAAYRKIWDERGSPLRYHSEDLRAGLEARLGRPVRLGMRYGKPGIAPAIAGLKQAGAQRVQVLPLFPQYSESAFETAAQAAMRAAKGSGLELELCPPFFAHPAFLDAFATRIRDSLADFTPDKVLLSYHGLPERHVQKTDESGAHCLKVEDCCAKAGPQQARCYRAHCFATSRGLASRLGWQDADYEITFQSRLGRTPWIQPFTDQRIAELAAAGCQRLAVACPAFVADCLETLEEIGMAAAEDFRKAGGNELRLIPSLNAEAWWIEALAEILGS